MPGPLAADMTCKREPPAEPVEIKKHQLWTKKEHPDKLKLGSANLTQNMDEVFSMTEKDINILEHTKWIS